MLVVGVGGLSFPPCCKLSHEAWSNVPADLRAHPDPRPAGEIQAIGGRSPAAGPGTPSNERRSDSSVKGLLAGKAEPLFVCCACSCHANRLYRRTAKTSSRLEAQSRESPFLQLDPPAQGAAEGENDLGRPFLRSPWPHAASP